MPRVARQVSTPDSNPGLPRQLLAGASGALAAVAIVLTHGLLAWAPLGADAARLGIAAAFATVIAGGLVFALFSSAVSPSAGPSSATALILAGLVATLARDPAVDLGTVAGLAAVTGVAAASVVLMGVLQMALGLLGLGGLARFVPQPVLAGFMNGVAVLILVSQLPLLLGLPPFSVWTLADAGTLARVQPLTLAVGLATAVMVWLIARTWPRAPAALLGLTAGTVLYMTLATHLPGMPLGPTVGALPQGIAWPDALAPLAAPAARGLLERHLAEVFTTAAVLALIGALESLLGAAATDQLTHHRHDPRRELLAMGAANIASGLCGGLAVVLHRSRAIVLIEARALGRVGALSSVALLALLYAAGGPLLTLLPRTVLAGIMLTIAVALIDQWTRQLLRQLRAGERSPDLLLSVAMVAAVCGVTVAFGFVQGVMVGLLLALGVFIRHMSRSLVRSRGNAAQRPSRRVYGAAQEALLLPARRRIALLELEGALWFGNAERLAREAESLDADCRGLVLDLRRVSAIDESGAVLLQQMSRQLAAGGQRLWLAGVTPDSPHGRRLRAYGCFRESPRDDWFSDADRAIEAAERQLLADAGGAAPQAAVPLAASTLLRGLAPAALARVSELLVERRLAAGERLFRAGDPGDRLFVLTEGSISILGPGGDAAPRYVSFWPGAMLGEIAMLDGSGRSADALADVPSVLHQFSRGALDRLNAVDPELGARLTLNIALHLAERLRSAGAVWASHAG